MERASEDQLREKEAMLETDLAEEAAEEEQRRPATDDGRDHRDDDEAAAAAAGGSSWWRRREPADRVTIGSWWEIKEILEKMKKYYSLVVHSASTASFVLLLLFVATLAFSRGIDSYAFRRSTSYQSSTFRVTNVRTPDYPHIDEHPFSCDSTNTTYMMTLTCPANYPPRKSRSKASPTCPDYFRWIHEDLKPWKRRGIAREMVEEIEKYPQFRHFRLIIVNGTAYVKQYSKSFQTRDVFTLWGVLQLLKMYPGQVPDLDLMFQCHDQPSIRKSRFWQDKALPLFHYCGSDDTYDVVFPDWSFWGWPEINVKPWMSLKKNLEHGNRMVNWTNREPYAYWRGNLYTGARRKLGRCNSTEKWNALIYHQNWAKEIREGFKNSDMSAQCTHRYKIYMEGNAWSVSEKYILACDSMALLVNPIFYDFFTRSLVPLKHYWPIDSYDICRSIKFAIDWGNHHPEQAQEMGRAGSRFVQEEISMQNVYDYMFHVLSEYGKLLAYRPTIPPGAVELCSEKWVCTSDDLQRIFKMYTLVKGPAKKRPCSLPPPFEQKDLLAFVKEKANNVKKVEAWRSKGWSD